MKNACYVEFDREGRSEVLYNVCTPDDYPMGTARVCKDSLKVKLSLYSQYRLKGLENKIKEKVRQKHLFLYRK